MNQQQIKLGLSLKEAGIDLSVESFDHRLIVQKATYILQQAEVFLGYRYRWYLRGPYSSDLADDLFTFSGLKDKGESKLLEWTLDEQSLARIRSLRDIFTNNGSLSDLAKKLELFGSVLFLIKTKQANAEDPENISEILKKNDKIFEADQVSEALVVLQKHGLINPPQSQA